MFTKLELMFHCFILEIAFNLETEARRHNFECYITTIELIAMQS